MERNINQNGRMTADRVEALRSYVEKAEIMRDYVAEMKNATAVSKEEATRLGFLLIGQSMNKVTDEDRMRELIRDGADINLMDKSFDKSALMVASWYGTKDAVRVLLESGANVELKNEYGETALIIAAIYGYDQIVAQLLRRGADLNAKDNEGRTALDKTAEEKTKALLEAAMKGK